MKILILNYEYPPLGGGAGVVSKYHAEGFAKAAIKTTVLTTWYEGEKELSEEENLTIIKLKSKRRYNYKSTADEWISWIQYSKKFLSGYLTENKFDYCFAHFALPGGEVARYINRKFKIPYAVISHGQDIPWFFPKQMFKYHLITYFWIKHICNKADKLILLTGSMKKNADRFMGKQKNKNIIVPNGCETKEFFPSNFPKNEIFTILFVGRLVDQKDPFTFLKAVELLRNKNNTNFQVLILGDGPLKHNMQQFVKEKGLEKNIIFKGWVDKKTIIGYYQSANIIVSTSSDEAMSIAALEALSTGIYMISTPVSGNTDVIEKGKNGDFIEFKNSKQLASKLENCIDNPSVCTVDSEFLAQFRQKYNWGNVVNELIKVLNSSGLNI
ncbi:MAG: glycosyltransferase family 4 protein [Bacteroidota bacterium]